MMRATLALIALSLGSSCYIGKTREDRAWSPEAIARIEVGKTSKADVLKLLGPPKTIIRLLDSEAYMYTARVQKETRTYLLVVNLTRSDTQFDAITVIINRQDVVTAVGSRFATDQAEYGLP